MLKKKLAKTIDCMLIQSMIHENNKSKAIEIQFNIATN